MFEYFDGIRNESNFFAKQCCVDEDDEELAQISNEMV